MKSTLAILVLSCLVILSLQNSFQCNVSGCQYCSFPNSCGLCQNNNVLQFNTTSGAFYCQSVTCPPIVQLAIKIMFVRFAHRDFSSLQAVLVQTLPQEVLRYRLIVFGEIILQIAAFAVMDSVSKMDTVTQQ